MLSNLICKTLVSYDQQYGIDGLWYQYTPNTAHGHKYGGSVILYAHEFQFPKC